MGNKIIEILLEEKLSKAQSIVAINNLIEFYNGLQFDFQQKQERRKIDVALGRMPVYQTAKFYSEQKKDDGELLFNEKDWEEICRRTQSKEYEPVEKYIKKTPPIDLSNDFKKLMKSEDEEDKKNIMQEIKQKLFDIIKQIDKHLTKTK